jgi:hypothetical protein
MTRPTEGELVDMQRRARAVIETLNNAEGSVKNRRGNALDFQDAAERIGQCSDLAERVSDDIDKLADWIRSADNVTQRR